MSWWPFKKKPSYRELDRHILLLFRHQQDASRAFRAAVEVAHPDAKIIRSVGVIRHNGLRIEFSVQLRVERYKGRYWDVVIPMVEQDPAMVDHLRVLLF